MAERRFGPTLGPGVAVIEKDSGRQIQESALGVTAVLGALQKGHGLMQCRSLKDFTRKCGGRISSSLLPDACQDFWLHSNGAGELNVVRVTDGTEEKGVLYLWSRQTTSSVNKGKVIKIEAKDGGRWAGRTQVAAGVFGSLTATTITLASGEQYATNELTGGYVHLDAVSGTTYKILSNTAADPCVITVEPGNDMSSDHAADPDQGYTVELQRDTDVEFTVQIGNGEIDSDLLFSLRGYLNGALTHYYPNLSMDPSSPYYFVTIINNDDRNVEFTVTDLNTSGYAGTMRPATYYGISTAVAEKLLTIKPFQYEHTVGDAGATVAISSGDLTTDMRYACRLTLTVLAGDATFSVTAQFLEGETQSLATGTIGTKYELHPFVPPFTVTNAGNALEEDDVIVIDYFPLEPDALIGSYLYPDQTNAADVNARYVISDNGIDTISIASGDLTSVASSGNAWMVNGKAYLAGGYDGGTPAVADFLEALDEDATLFNGLMNAGKGLVKIASPGITSLLNEANAVSVQKAIISFAEGRNWFAKVEAPSTKTTEQSAIDYYYGSSGIGQTTYAANTFPSYYNVVDPDNDAAIKSVPLSGAVLGREAMIARDYDGYHKAAAGINVTLIRAVSLPATELDEELLNPRGINVVKIYLGNSIVYGDRTMSADTQWKYKHWREQMSHYELTLQDSFPWAIFEINDPQIERIIHSALVIYFRKEWKKKALRGTRFEDAARIKVDSENNTDASRAAGDVNAEIGLVLADTTERLIFTMSKNGIFES